MNRSHFALVSLVIIGMGVLVLGTSPVDRETACRLNPSCIIATGEREEFAASIDMNTNQYWVHELDWGKPRLSELLERELEWHIPLEMPTISDDLPLAPIEFYSRYPKAKVEPPFFARMRGGRPRKR